MNTIEKAKQFAIKAHADLGQLYDGQPYEVHLQAVVNMAIKYEGVGPTYMEYILAACWCHDVIEDTKFSYQDVKREIGIDVADIVYDVSNELGKNRRERSLKTYAKIAANPNAIFVKLCDRLANVSHHGDLFEMYKREYPIFRYFLYNKRQYIPMWEDLDALMKYEKV